MIGTEHLVEPVRTKPKKHHSLPISTAEREKREFEAAEHERLERVFGELKITRNANNYITMIEKLAEDIVVETSFTRDSNNYITGIAVRKRIRRLL
jgi:hypothetical protein